MAEQFLSAVWYRVAELVPTLRGQADVCRHRYRGQSWYVMSDPASGRVHRFTPAAYAFIRAMDGQNTVDKIWARLAVELEDSAPTQDEIIRLLSQLHEADMLQLERLPHADEFARLVSRQRRLILKSALKNPLALTIPLWDPDAFLNRWIDILRPLFTRAGLVIWAGFVLPAVVLAALYFEELTRNITDRILSAEGLILIAVTYPVVKALHELGHAFALKAMGREVHQLGVMLIAFYPVPYVDASAAAILPDKYHRALIGAAGIMVELALGAGALYIWLSAEPGLVRALAFDVIFIAGVSTLLVNGNPLLRFDGYYVLIDLIEIPNLAARSARFWRKLAERYLFGARRAQLQLDTVGERIWFTVYGPASYFYRIAILIGLSLFVASEFFFVGVVIAVVSLVAAVVLPFARGLRNLVRAAQLEAGRRRTMGILVSGAVATAALLCVIPIPLHTNSEGVVWLPEESYVRAGADGFITGLAAEPGARVTRGDMLVESVDPLLEMQVRTRRLRLGELELRLEAERFTDRVQAEITRQELAEEQSRLASDLEKSDRLRARSQREGTFVTPTPADLPGRYFRKGEVLGYVLPDSARTVRVIIPQDDIDLVRNRLREVNVRSADDALATIRAQIVREVPAAKDELPSKALGSSGGGVVASDPRDSKGAKSLRRLFQVDLALEQELHSPPFGARMYVRFEHDWEPIAMQAYRKIRQLFLSRFNA